MANLKTIIAALKEKGFSLDADRIGDSVDYLVIAIKAAPGRLECEEEGRPAFRGDVGPETTYKIDTDGNVKAVRMSHADARPDDSPAARQKRQEAFERANRGDQLPYV
jgi:hypothetical protein